MAPRVVTRNSWAFRGLTFELRRDQRQDTRPGPVKMYRVPPARAWRPAVGPRLERRVRRHFLHYPKKHANLSLSTTARAS